MNTSSGDSRFLGHQILVEVAFKPNFNLNFKIVTELELKILPH